MEHLDEIELNGENLEGLPLFFRTIFYNSITDTDQEYKLIRFNPVSQSDLMRATYSGRPISKTIDYSLFKTNEHE